MRCAPAFAGHCTKLCGASLSCRACLQAGLCSQSMAKQCGRVRRRKMPSAALKLSRSCHERGSWCPCLVILELSFLVVRQCVFLSVGVCDLMLIVIIWVPCRHCTAQS